MDRQVVGAEGVGGGVLDAPARFVERPALAVAVDQRQHGDARAGPRGELPGDVRVGVADDDDDGSAARGGDVAHAADHLAVEALGVEVALAGDDDIGDVDPLVELEVLGDEVEPADEASAEGGQSTGQPAGRAAAVELA